MAVLENDENNPHYTRSDYRITKSWSPESGLWMPKHLLFDILILLPVATLLRLKSVCKLWFALISSSNFIARHLDRNRGKEKIIGIHDLVYERFEMTSYKSCLLSGKKYENYCNFDCENFVKDPERPERFSSDGIVCIVHSDPLELEAVDLWNPAMKQLRRLPESEQVRRRLPEPSLYYEYGYSINGYSINYGFGYSVRSDDYKFVRTFVHEENMDNNAVEVYSLRADSWRTIIEDGVLPFKFIKRPISRNGMCFWIGSDRTRYAYYDEYCHHSVVSFDLHDETFGTMPLPHNTGVFSVLDFLGDKLAFISGLRSTHIAIHGSRDYEIWVLHEYGVKESWSKIWKIGPTDKPWTDEVYFPFGFSTNGDYLLLTDTEDQGFGTSLHSGNVVMYKLGTEEEIFISQKEYIKLRPLGLEILMFVRCMESLIPVKRVNAAY